MCPACGIVATVVFEPPTNIRSLADKRTWPRLCVEDSVSLVGRYLCANDFESEVIC